LCVTDPISVEIQTSHKCDQIADMRGSKPRRFDRRSIEKALVMLLQSIERLSLVHFKYRDFSERNFYPNFQSISISISTSISTQQEITSSKQSTDVHNLRMLLRLITRLSLIHFKYHHFNEQNFYPNFQSISR
jgi:hypothetical protein